MTYRYMKNENTLPVWVALAAPLIGVPSMVALLAIAAPETEVPSDAAVPAMIVEPAGDTGEVVPASTEADTEPQPEAEPKVG